MNYRHAYHAGNFADVFKHVILTRVLLYLARKDAAFRVIDTHAGEGVYDLSAEPAEKTAEWQRGIGRLLAAQAPPEVQALLAPYLAIVMPGLSGTPPLYPGSPFLTCQLLRRQDRMIFCDAQPDVIAALKGRREFARDRRIKMVEIDGFVALGAFIPPIERRGLVLVDPSFEIETEFERLSIAVAAAARKWPTGIYLVWYPIKDSAKVRRFLRALVSTEIGSVLRMELHVGAPERDGPLVASGLVILNPPYQLDAEARQLLPYLARIMATDGQAGADISWLRQE